MKTKNTKPKKKLKEVKKEIPKEEPIKEEEIKDVGTISDGVLDAFEETVPPVVDPLLVEDELVVGEDDDEDGLDYNPAEW